MKLFFRKFGESGKPLVILHGLFGQSDNWTSLARAWSDKFMVYTIDQRNHGQSPQEDAFSYALMAEDFEKAKEFSTEDTKGMLDFMKSLSSMGGEKKEATKKEYKDLKCTVDAGDSTAVCNYKEEYKDEKINLKKKTVAIY